MTEEQRQFGLALTQDFSQFQEKLNAETEEGKYRILATLLADQFRSLEKIPLA
ncbi:MAG: hypothetical protein ACXWLJ_11120 [Rhizomicrobium sp.]